MASCEKCWKDADADPDKYVELVSLRNVGKPCTPEEQAGEDAKECPKCKKNPKGDPR